jgi:asparagine synthase (glutamine-hydrolysing)
MAALVGATHHQLLLSIDDLLKFLPQMVFHQDEPVADPVCVPLYYVSRLARDHGVKVCQVGEGADELFIGYPSWKRQLKVQHWSDAYLPTSIRPALKDLLTLWPWQDGPRYEYLRRAARGQPVFWSGAGAFTETEKSRLMASPLRRKLKGVSSYDVVAPIRDRFLQMAWEPSDVNWMSYMDINHRLPEVLLMRVDKMSMAASLEARVPFLDHRLVTLALSLPSKMRFKDGVHKYLLKKAVQGLVPEDVIQRPKQGFGVPLADWMLVRLGQESRDTVQRFCAESNFLNWNEVARVFSRGETARIWSLWNLASWWFHHFSPAPDTGGAT